MRVFSNSFGCGCTLGRSWAIEGAQEQVDRDTPVSITPTKEEMAGDVEDSARKGKEKVVELPKSTKKWGGGRRSRGTGGKSLDTHHFEAQRRAELKMPFESTATISMPKSM
jgi:hypothetical protein